MIRFETLRLFFFFGGGGGGGGGGERHRQKEREMSQGRQIAGSFCFLTEPARVSD